jgi:hypothetical protein
MCLPAIPPAVLLASTLAISAASAGASFISAQQQAAAQAEAQAEHQERTAENARVAFLNSAATENARIEEERAATSQDIFETGIQAKKARATAVTAAGEAGVSGISVDALLREFSATESRHNEAVRQNLAFSEAQSARNIEAARTGAKSAINRARPQPVSRPNFFGAALRFGGEALGAFGDFNATQSGTS